MDDGDVEIGDSLRRMWTQDRASQWLGMRLARAGAGRAVLTMTVREEMTNGHAIGHGGLTFALADSAFAFACNSWGPVTVAHSAEIRFHAPTHVGDELTATATMRSREGRRGIYDVEVRARADDGDRLVATFVGHATQLPPEPGA